MAAPAWVPATAIAPTKSNRKSATSPPAKRQLLFLSPGAWRGGYDFCAVLSDPVRCRAGQGHAERQLSQRERGKVTRTVSIKITHPFSPWPASEPAIQGNEPCCFPWMGGSSPPTARE